MFLLISGGHIGAPKRYTNMSSPYKALQRCVKRFGKLLRNFNNNNNNNNNDNLLHLI